MKQDNKKKKIRWPFKTIHTWLIVLICGFIILGISLYQHSLYQDNMFINFLWVTSAVFLVFNAIGLIFSLVEIDIEKVSSKKSRKSIIFLKWILYLVASILLFFIFLIPIIVIFFLMNLFVSSIGSIYFTIVYFRARPRTSVSFNRPNWRPTSFFSGSAGKKIIIGGVVLLIFFNLFNYWSIAYGSADPESPSIAVDSHGNAHVIWVENTDTNFYPDTIFYSKLSKSGDIIIERKEITKDPIYLGMPSIAIDSTNKIHLVYESPKYGEFKEDSMYRHGHIFYMKLDESGNKLIKEKKISNSLIDLDTCSGNYPNIIVDKNDFIHIVWRSDFRNTIIYYEKLDHEGNIIIDNANLEDLKVIPQHPIVLSNDLLVHLNLGEHCLIDSKDNMHIFKREKTKLNENYSYEYYINYSKLSPNGTILFSNRTIEFVSISDAIIDYDDNIHIINLEGTICYEEDKIHYTKLDSNGNILVKDKIIKHFTKSPYSLDNHPPSVFDINMVVDMDNELHVVYRLNDGDNSFSIHYMKLDNNGGKLIEDKTIAPGILSSLSFCCVITLILIVIVIIVIFYQKRKKSKRKGKKV